MKMGLVSAILDGWTFEEMIDTCSGMGFECVEVACWPNGKAERRENQRHAPAGAEEDSLCPSYIPPW